MLKFFELKLKRRKFVYSSPSPSQNKARKKSMEQPGSVAGQSKCESSRFEATVSSIVQMTVTREPKRQQPQDNISNSNEMPKEMTYFQLLLMHLISLKAKNDDLKRQRLSLQKEILELEKSAFDNFFNPLSTEK